MNNYSLHDFIENYPCQNDSDIQWKTACRKEFNELKSDKTVSKKMGKFFNHQELLSRYIRQYDRIFNIHGTGTGKSGSIINMAEYYKKSGEDIKRVHVLEPGPPTVKDFREQIVKLSNPDDYTNEKIKKATDLRTVRNNLTRIIQEWYSVETYSQFCKLNLTDDEIIETYSDTLIFLDEAHKYKSLEDSKGGNMTSNESVSIYEYLWKVTHLAKRTKIIVSSATPMINSSKDFVALLNLLLPMDFQLPMNVDDSFYDKLTAVQLEPYFRGKITFIKFLETNINIINEGEVFSNYIHNILVPSKGKGPALIPVIKTIREGFVINVENPKQNIGEGTYKKFNSQVSLHTLEMKGVQLETYKKNETKKTNFFFYPRQTSVFVFPDGSIGKVGFDRYTERDELKNIILKQNIFVGGKKLPGLPKFIKGEESERSTTLKNLEMLSCKFKFYIEKEIEASKQKRPGNSFCYIEFVESAGAILIGLLLKIFGFEEYNGVISHFDLKTKKLTRLRKQKRFSLITGQTPNIENILRLFNSNENIDGKYLQIIIASSSARDGINCHNVLRGYMMTPGWHESGMHQALSRFIRADSHDLMSQRRREEGISGKIDIFIYKLAAVMPDEEDRIDKNSKISIDISNYFRSERKDIEIKRILRIMKQTSFDAYINYERNTDIEGNYNSETDYEAKYYKIWKSDGKPFNDERKGMAYNQGPNRSEYVYNTYNLFYTKQIIGEIKEILIDVLREKYCITFKDFLEILKEQNLKANSYAIITAIEELIKNKEVIRDSKNISSFNISMSGSVLYFNKITFNDNTRLSTESNYYIDIPYELLVKEEVLDEDSDFSFMENYTVEEITNYYIDKQNYKLFKNLIERSLVNLRDKILTPLNEKILELFDNYILILKKPENYIKLSETALSDENKSGQGRNRAQGSVAGLKYLNLSDKEPGFTEEIVYTHFYRESEKTGFGITSVLDGSNRKIRVLGSTGDFRNASAGENFVYSYFFTEKYNKLMKKYKESRYYGTYIYRGGENEKYMVDKKKVFFRIIDNSNPRNKGQVCRTDKTEKIIDIIKYFKPDEVLTGRFKDSFCEKLMEIFREKDLLFVSF